MRTDPPRGWEDAIPDDPAEADRWVRLLDRFNRLHSEPGDLARLFRGQGHPTVSDLLAELAGDGPALGEDLALQAWCAVDAGRGGEAKQLFDQALALDPRGQEVRILEATLGLAGEARLAALRAIEAGQLESLDQDSLAAIDEGRGEADLDILRLHRGLAEQARVHAALEQHEACLDLTDRMFTEAGQDTFAVFPLMIQSALACGDLDVLDFWIVDRGGEYPGLGDWLQVYLAQSSGQAGAAFQALRRARKTMPSLEVAFLKAEALATFLRTDGDGPKPVLELPKGELARETFLMLLPAFAADADFMAWLRGKRNLH